MAVFPAGFDILIIFLVAIISVIVFLLSVTLIMSHRRSVTTDPFCTPKWNVPPSQSSPYHHSQVIADLGLPVGTVHLVGL